jgi:hypothetical protein
MFRHQTVSTIARNVAPESLVPLKIFRNSHVFYDIPLFLYPLILRTVDNS